MRPESEPGERGGHKGPRRARKGQPPAVTAAGAGIIDDRRAPTTTLAGWRQFVQDDPVTLRLLPEPEWAALDDASRGEYDEARIGTTPSSSSSRPPSSGR